MALNFELIGAPSPVVLALCRPSTSVFKIRDPAIVEMCPWLPWKEVTLDGEVTTIVGVEAIALLFSDDINIPEEVIQPIADVPWACAQITPAALLRLRGVMGTAAMPRQRYENLNDFRVALRAAFVTLPEWPSLLPGELVATDRTDFTQAEFQPFIKHRWMERLTLRALMGGSTRASGWGFLTYVSQPISQPQERYTHGSAFLSIASQWEQQVSDGQFLGSSVGVRVEAFCSEALAVLRRAGMFEHLQTVPEASVEREREFVNLLRLGSMDEKVRKPAFRSKIVEIIKAEPELPNLRKVLGRTEKPEEAALLLRGLGSAFSWKGDDSIFDFLALRELNELLTSPRLDFLDAEGAGMTDTQRVAHVVKTRKDHVRAAGGAAAGPKGDFSGADGESKPESYFLSSSQRVAKFEKLHLSVRHQTAVREIQAVLDGNPTRMDVLTVVFKQAIPSLNRHMLGKEVAVGLPVYDQLMPYRCHAGPSGDVDSVIGEFMGRQLLRDDQGVVPEEYSSACSLQGTGVVGKFLNGHLDDISFENELLSHITKVKANVSDPMIPESERFLKYVLVDRMISEVSPLFEAFGLGGPTHPASFAAILNECKQSLVQIMGLSDTDQHDLLRGERHGIQPILLKALGRANTTLVKLFAERDPLVTVERDSLLPRDDTAFVRDLAVSRKATSRRKQEQVVFGSSYHSGAVTTGDSISKASSGNQSIDTLRSQLKSMRGQRFIEFSLGPLTVERQMMSPQ